MKKQKKPKDPVKEIAIFAIGIGILLGIAAYFTLTGLKRAPDLCGIKRSMAIGIPLAVIAISNAVSGILLLKSRSSWAIALCILSAVLLGGSFFIFELLTVGILGCKLISVIIYAIPLILVLRGSKAIKSLKAKNQEELDVQEPTEIK